jgi:hypothetical protein
MSLPIDTDPPDNPEAADLPSKDREIHPQLGDIGKVTEGLGIEAGHFSYAALVRATKAEISNGIRGFAPARKEHERK